MEDNSVNNTNAVDSEFKDVAKKKSSVVSAIVIVLIVAIVGCVGYFGYKKFFAKTPTDLFASTIKSSVKKMNTALEKVSTISQSNAKVKIKVDGAMFSMLGLDVLNDYEINLDAKVDPNNKISASKVNLVDTKKNDKLEFTMYLKEGNMYLDLGDVYNGLLKVELPDDEDTKAIFERAFSNASENNFTKANYLLNKVTDLYLSTLKDEEFKNEKVTVNVNGTDKELNSTSIIYDQKKASSVITTIVKGLLEDQVSINYISNMYNLTNQEVIDKLNELLESVSTESDSTDTLNITLYTVGASNKFAGVNFKFGEEEVYFYNVDKNIDIKLDTLTVKGSYAKGGKVNVNFDDKTSIELTFNEEATDKKLDVDYKFIVNSSSSSVPEISGNLKVEESTSGSTINNNGSLSVSITTQGMSSTVTFTVESIADTKPATIELDTTNAKVLDESLSKEISNKLMQKISNFRIVKAISESSFVSSLTN